MKISDGERLILLMLSEISEKLEIDGDIDPKFIQSAIYNEHLWGVSWKYSGIPFENSAKDTPKEVSEVCDILDMWSIIEDSYSALSNEDKNSVKEQVGPLGDNPKFSGFDGNNECEYMSIARFLIDDLERFESFKGRGLNSHLPSIDTHNRMLNVFRPLRTNLHSRLLNAHEIVEILRQRIHLLC